MRTRNYTEFKTNSTVLDYIYNATYDTNNTLD